MLTNLLRYRLRHLAVLALALSVAAPALGADTESLAGRIAESLVSLEGKGSRYKTIAFSQIRKSDAAALDLNELVDYATTRILQTVLELDVVNRAQMQRILKEQQFQLSDIVSADEYKQLGRLTGVDLFIYGTLYSDHLVLKAIDVQTSAIAWADAFALGDPATARREFLVQLGEGIVASMKDNPRVERARIETVSFWGFKTPPDLSEEEMVDFLTVAITQDGTFAVVDRDQLKLVLGEQALSREVYFDEESAKELGGIYGVQAFIHGNVRESNGQLVADFKMTDITTGKFVWAAILRYDESAAGRDGRQPGRQVAPAPSGTVLVAGGPFVQGTDGSPAEARPAHRANVSGFFIDTTEVSNQEYLAFVKQGHRAPVSWQGDRFAGGAGSLPVVGVTWDDARDYCRFVGKRLPSEAEWEKAARGTDGQTYPWGKVFVPGYTVIRESGRKGPVPVQEAGKDVSPYGVKHMAGNVREWVRDVFQPYSGSSASNPAFGKERVVRGGSWAKTSREARTFHRGSSKRNLAWPDVGFRCAKSAGSGG